MRYISRNVMAREKALYAGHAVAAVAATSASIAAAALKLIEVDYEVLPWVIDVDEALQPGAPILHEHMRDATAKPGPATTSNIAGTLEHKLGDCRRRVCGCRRHHRAQLQDQARAPGLHRAARLPRQHRQGRPLHHLEQQPGPLHGARHDGPADRPEAQSGARDSRRDRRRLRRQDHRLSGAAGHGAGAQVRAPGQDRDEPPGRVPRHGPDLGLVEHGQDRRHQGRQDHRPAGDHAAAGGRLPGLADPRRRRLLRCAL